GGGSGGAWKGGGSRGRGGWGTRGVPWGVEGVNTRWSIQSIRARAAETCASSRASAEIPVAPSGLAPVRLSPRTRAPERPASSATARPIPELAPTTTTRLPSRPALYVRPATRLV